MHDSFVLKDNMLRFLLPAAQTAGRLCIAEFTCRPGAGPPPHQHDLEEWFYVLEGEIELSGPLSGQWASATATTGDSAYIPSGVPHTYRAAGDGVPRFLVVMAPGSIEGYFRKVGKPCTPETVHELLTQDMDMDLVRNAFVEFGMRIYDPGVPWTGEDIVLTKGELYSLASS